MPTSVFQYGPMGGNYAIYRDSVGEVWNFPLVSGDVIPVSGIEVTDASFYFSNINHTSSQRQARIDLENVGTLGGPFVTLGDGSYGPLAEPCVLTPSMYSGVSSMLIRIRGNGTGGSTGTCFSIRSDCIMTLTVTWKYSYTRCTPPTSVGVSGTNVAPGAGVTLSWAGAAPGTGMGIDHYDVYRSTNGGASYDFLQSVWGTSLAVTAPDGNGASYLYKVITVGTVAGYHSELSNAYATLTCSFSAPSAPSTVTIGGDVSAFVAPGTNVTIAWAGAGAGTNNPITGYHVYRDGSFYAATTGTSLSVPAHNAAGGSYTYTVYALGTYANSGPSVGRAVYSVGTPSAPTAVAVSAALANPGAAVSLSWSGAGPGSYSDIAGYHIYRSTSVNGAYEKIGEVSTSSGSGSVSVAAPSAQGAVYYFRVYTIGQRSNSAISAAYAALTANTAPAAPGVTAPVASKIIYNSQPRILATVGSDTDGHSQTLAASGYAVSSAGAQAPGKKLVLRRSSAAGAGAQSISVTSTDTMGMASSAVDRSFTYAVPAWTDTNLVAGETPIKAVHMTELQAAINNVRAYYGMAAYAFTAITAGVTGLAGWTSHVAELRAAIDQVVSLVNGWDTANGTHDISLPAWIAISVNCPAAAVIAQLRAAIPLL